MDTHALIPLIIFLGVVSPWLVWLFFRWHVVAPPPDESAVCFRFSHNLRVVGLVLMIAGPGSLLFMVSQVPTESYKPGDWLVMLVLSLLIGGLGSIIGFETWRMQVCTGSAGLWGYSIWGLPCYLDWREASEAQLKVGLQALCFKGSGKSVYIPVLLDDWPGFLTTIRQAAPHLLLPDAARLDGAKLAHEGQFQSLYDNAWQLFLVAAVITLITLPFLPLYLPASGLSVLAGSGLAFLPLLRRLAPKLCAQEGILGGILQMVGVAIPTFMILRAMDVHQEYLGGEENIMPVLWIALFGQHFGIACLTALVLLLAARCAMKPPTY